MSVKTGLLLARAPLSEVTTRDTPTTTRAVARDAPPAPAGDLTARATRSASASSGLWT